MLKPDRGVHPARHRASRDLGVAVRHADRRLFVHGRHEAERRIAQHAVVDDRLVQPEKGVARHRREMRDAKRAHHVDHMIAAAGREGPFLVTRRGLAGRGDGAGQARGRGIGGVIGRCRALGEQRRSPPGGRGYPAERDPFQKVAPAGPPAVRHIVSPLGEGRVGAPRLQNFARTVMKKRRPMVSKVAKSVLPKPVPTCGGMRSPMLVIPTCSS